MSEKKSEEKRKPAGGIPFFLSLAFLFVVLILNLLIVPVLIDLHTIPRLLVFAVATLLGGVVTMRYVRGHFSVYLHELKHKILSILAGNRSKKLRVESAETGYFEYSYTKDTAHMNAMIALAPYFLPIFTLPTIALCYYLLPDLSWLSLLIVGVAYGIDLVHSLREISPVQTDLTEIRGGYLIALLYIVAMQGALLTFLTAWVLAGSEGISILFLGYFAIMKNFFVSASLVSAR